MWCCRRLFRYLSAFGNNRANDLVTEHLLITVTSCIVPTMRENRFLLFLNHLRLPYSIPKSFALLLSFHWWWQIRFPILRNCFLLFVRAVQGVPTKSVHTSYWGLSKEFSCLIEFHLCKDNWFCFSYKQKGLYLHDGNRK